MFNIFNIDSDPSVHKFFYFLNSLFNSVLGINVLLQSGTWAALLFIRKSTTTNSMYNPQMDFSKAKMLQNCDKPVVCPVLTMHVL